MNITTNGELRVAIQQAEMCAARMTMRGHHLTIGERAVIARLLIDLAQIGRRAFDPTARVALAPEPPAQEADAQAPLLFNGVA
jgi:hypothetical protein